MSSFTFKGISSASYNWLIVQELPPITVAPKRIEHIEIEGRDGDILVDKGYQAYSKKIVIGLSKTATQSNIDALFGWLNGSGSLVLSNEPTMTYEAAMISQIDLERLLKYRTATVEFWVQPTKVLTSSTSTVTDTDTIVVNNQGNYPSSPIVEAKLTPTQTTFFVRVSVLSNVWFTASFTVPAASVVYTFVLDIRNKEFYVKTIAGATIQPSTIIWVNDIHSLEHGNNNITVEDPSSIWSASEIKVIGFTAFV